MIYKIHTYGCQMNINDSAHLDVYFLAHSYNKSVDKKGADADLHVFNTCCIRDTAEQKIINHIAEICKKKKERPNMIVAVIGCLTARAEVVSKLRAKYPIDIMLGTHKIDELLTRISQIQSVRFPLVLDGQSTKILKAKPPAPDIDALGRHAYYINISYGCENFCSYCIVPFVRGGLRHRAEDEIVLEFEALCNSVPNDAPTVIYLLGQNVNSYPNFPNLLEKLAKKITRPNIFVNFLSSHPKDFSADLACVIAKNETVDRNIHLPLQSGSSRILKLMNRRYTAEDYLEKVNLLRSLVPNVRLTTDIICGFPTETEQDFEDTKNFVRKVKFNAAFIFPYSRRSGTAADKMTGQLDIKTKKARATELIKLQREISK